MRKNNNRIVYNYSKRTKGDFIDALFLGGIIVTAFLWMMILIYGR